MKFALKQMRCNIATSISYGIILSNHHSANAYTHSVYPENPDSCRASVKISSLCLKRLMPMCTVVARKDSKGNEVAI